MFAYIRGKLTALTPNFAVVEVQGIGYKILTPQSTSEKLELDREVLLHTSFVVREFSQNLYGFYTEEDRELFEILIEISGVGPKTALNLIGHLPCAELQQVVLLEDAHALSQVPGIGKKTAERLLIELRNKLDHFRPVSPKPQNQKHQDALKALINLGYKHTIAQKALKKSLEKDPHLELSSLIASALKHV